jgi:lipoprotein-releasing system permease protein
LLAKQRQEKTFMSSLETWIGLRGLRAKKRNGFVSVIGAFAVVGIAIGVMALIIVLAVMSGFQKEIRGQLLNVAPHLEMGYYAADGEPWQDLQKIADKQPGVIGSAPFIVDQALLSNSGEVRGVPMRGIDPKQEGKVADYVNKMASGKITDLKSGEFNIVLGEDLAMALDVKVGEKVTVITPEGNVTPAGMVPRLKQFTLVGTVKTRVYEVDNTLALIDLKDAQVLYRLGDEVTGVRMKLSDPQNAPALTSKIVPKEISNKVWARDWTYQNRTYFEAVALEKKMMFIILSVIILVASLNLISSLVMAVTEKQADIAILRTLGMSPAGIMKIFMVQGSVVGFFGVFLGVAIGVPLAMKVGVVLNFFEQAFGFKIIQAQVYFLDYLPSDVKWVDVVSVAAVALVLSFIATIFPSYKAAKTQPAEALRHE